MWSTLFKYDIHLCPCLLGKIIGVGFKTLIVLDSAVCLYVLSFSLDF